MKYIYLLLILFSFSVNAKEEEDYSKYNSDYPVYDRTKHIIYYLNDDIPYFLFNSYTKQKIDSLIHVKSNFIYSDFIGQANGKFKKHKLFIDPNRVAILATKRDSKVKYYLLIDKPYKQLKNKIYSDDIYRGYNSNNTFYELEESGLDFSNIKKIFKEGQDCNDFEFIDMNEELLIGTRCKSLLEDVKFSQKRELKKKSVYTYTNNIISYNTLGIRTTETSNTIYTPYIIQISKNYMSELLKNNEGEKYYSLDVDSINEKKYIHIPFSFIKRFMEVENDKFK